MKPRKPPVVDTTITKADATALWHAVEALKMNVRVMKDMPDIAEFLPAEQANLKAASAALRKVQAIVRENRRERRTTQLVLDINTNGSTP